MNKKYIMLWVKQREQELRAMTGNQKAQLVIIDEPQINIDLQTLTDIVCRVTNLPRKLVFSKSRRHIYVQARQLICYYGRTSCGETLQCLADLVGFSDHSSVIHSIQEIKNYIDTKHPQVCIFVQQINDAILDIMQRQEKMIANELLSENQ